MIRNAVVWQRILFAMVWSSVLFAVESHGEEKITLKLPPAALAQWYKPANERQVWLHTMFSLRRELQAVEEYLELDNPELLGKWSGRLVEHYRSIGEMVPEWQKALETDAAEQLLEVAGQKPEAVRKNLDTIKESCQSCHKQFRALTALIYRTSDFEPIRIGKSTDGGGRSYAAEMKTLSRQVNRIKIAFEDGRDQAALEALHDLQIGLNTLREGCSECHRDDYPIERILGEEPKRVLEELEQSLGRHDQKAVGRKLGEAAVIICARCHAIHRTQYDVQQLLD